MFTHWQGSQFILAALATTLFLASVGQANGEFAGYRGVDGGMDGAGYETITSNTIPTFPRAPSLDYDSDAQTGYSGSFVYEYGYTNDDYYETIANYFKSISFLENIARDLNELYVLPYDVDIELHHCISAASFYDPDTREIVMCYEYIDVLWSAAYDYYVFDDAVEFMEEATRVIIYRQVGQALIDIHAPHISELEDDMLYRFSELLDTRPDISDQFDYYAYLESDMSDLGDFTVEYLFPDDRRHRSIMEYYHDSQFIESHASFLNEIFALPYDVPIILDECDEPNAFYYSYEIEIVLCYEYLEFVSELAAEYHDTYKERQDFVYAAIDWTLGHEVGHALIDIYSIPVTGAEEDAADQFATMLTLTYDEGSASTAAILEFLETGSNGYSDDELAFHGAHSLDLQRAYNIMCWMYGSDTDQFDYLVSDLELLPVERAVDCPAEYDQIVYSWLTLLDSYLKY